MVTATRRRRRAKPVQESLPIDEKKLLKPSQVGQRLSIGKTQVYALMNSGKLVYVDCGERCRRVDPGVLERFIESQTINAAAGC